MDRRRNPLKCVENRAVVAVAKNLFSYDNFVCLAMNTFFLLPFELHIKGLFVYIFVCTFLDCTGPG